MKPIAQSRRADTRETLWRTLQTFSFTRIVIAIVLLIYLSLNTKQNFGIANHLVNWEIHGAVYFVLAVVFALLSVYLRKRFSLQLLVQLAVDIAVISMLYVAGGGAKSGLAILFLFPLAGCAILASMMLALFSVSVVTFVLLGEGGYAFLTSFGEAELSRAGLYGAAFFAAVFVLNRLAARLLKQEELARQRGRDLQVQQAINRMVIADMGDGILVVGRDTRVFVGNPAAERMLGLSVPYGQARYRLKDIPSMAPIVEAYRTWAALPAAKATSETGSTAFVVVKPGDDLPTLNGASTISREMRRELGSHLKLRFVTVETEGLSEERTLIFLQDVTEIENQAQQLKLASMGRLTASIAHEVRNPLSAIAHAAALLGEDISNPAQSRLLSIVGDNVKRLNRMIEDILKLSRKAQSPREPLALAPLFADILGEFHEAHAVMPGLIQLGEMRSHHARFDPLHLREVVVNLLSNALRYASGRRGSIRIHAVSDMASRLEVHIQDDGPAIKPGVRAHLFEPFYTTSSKGTGLGLYVARELCLNNGAMLDYEYRYDGSSDGAVEPTGRFVITFATPDRA
ncbi:two-component sensor histidine kinase [Noviherbaspirillum cavernae]|uniref:histidine kinase n=1 Tax=Noviherbaspirillum cavernae TaxID=2320862 RepID=A0A418WY03_9BURK|nr:ATP-binding protein [Noviherbaspirillum cavernae]RJG05087.1 two-component sensor histidine kinase [Noviherbaspirillum cavernae]